MTGTVAYDFSGQVVPVVGASRGIGAGTARAFARAGASVAVVSRDQSAVDAVTASIAEAGGAAVGMACDVAQVVCWLASDGAHFVTGATVPVDGGQTAGVKPPQVMRAHASSGS